MRTTVFGFFVMSATMVLGVPATAQPLQQVTVVGHIPNARCMALNLTPEQMMDRSIEIAVREAPNSFAPQVGLTGATVIARDPAVAQNGFLQIMLADGRTGWVEARWLRPWTPRAGTHASCQPAQLSNGRFGFDIR